MRISELSTRSGVSTATVKYYAREGLLPAGEHVGYNAVEYGETHVARLRLIRALLEVGDLSVAAIRDVLGALDDDTLPLDQALGTAQHAIPHDIAPPSDASVARLRDLVERRGWLVDDRNPGYALAGSVLDAYRGLDRDDLAAVLERYADAARIVAEADLATVDAVEGRAAQLETVVVGTVLGDALAAGLRRLAQEDVARRAASPTPEGNLP